MKIKPIPLFDTLKLLDKMVLPVCYQDIAHQDDLIKVVDFLKQYNGSEGTFRAYRREMERLLQWAWLVANKSILLLDRQDIEKYITFCQKPPASWVGTKIVSRFVKEKNDERVPNPNWHLFVATTSKANVKSGIMADKKNYQLADKSLREIFTVIGSFYSFLVNENSIAVNPVALIRQKSKYYKRQQISKQVMKLSDKQWKYCLEVAEKMAAEQPAHHERTLFILNILYLLYLRISELVAKPKWSPVMSHFFKDSQAYWWFITTGKGNKERLISVSDVMLDALKRYRLHLGLSTLPPRNEDFPLVPKIRGKGAVTSEREIRKIIQLCFDHTIDELQKRGLEDEAESLEYATVHWLRHTGISDDINKHGRPLAHVRDDAGHTSILTTDRYNDIELKERYLSGKNKKVS